MFLQTFFMIFLWRDLILCCFYILTVGFDCAKNMFAHWLVFVITSNRSCYEKLDTYSNFML